MQRSRLVIRLLACLAVTIPGTVAGASEANAYNGPNAAKYADADAITGNRAFPTFGNDCTNFVSQAVHAGGFSYVGGTSETSGSQWWIRHDINALGVGVWNYSHTWSVANDYRNFLILRYPGGIDEGWAHGSSTANYTPNSMVTGDVLFYDWGQGEGVSHAAIQVGIGTDPGSGWVGNYVDQHSTNRRHAFWSLKPYNVHWSTTTVRFEHIATNNY